MRTAARTFRAQLAVSELAFGLRRATREQMHLICYTEADLDLAIREGWLVERWALAVSPSRLESPLAVYAPGARKPDFGSLAYTVSQRALLEPAPLRVITATRKGAALVGGFVPSPNHPGQVSHDLGVAAVLAALSYDRRPESMRWCGDGLLKTRHGLTTGFVPDAAIIGEHTAKPEIWIDFAGASYTAGRFEEMWRAAWQAGVNLEVW